MMKIIRRQEYFQELFYDGGEHRMSPMTRRSNMRKYWWRNKFGIAAGNSKKTKELENTDYEKITAEIIVNMRWKRA